jgi:hypothetical protein
MMPDVMNATTTNLSRAKKKAHLVIGREIEQALKPGRFIRYDDMFEFVRGLVAVQGKLGTMVQNDNAKKAVSEGDLGSFMTLCVKTKEWDQLANRIHSVDHAELEAVSHYDSEPVANGLAKRDGLAASKVCRALCLRILNSKKSKYYDAALRHLRIARDLYVRTRHDSE